MGSYLFARPGFVVGLASIVDFANTLSEYNYANTGEQADYFAVRTDWETVGDDIRAAFRELRDEVEADGETSQATG
jgi:hypothetical protein